LFETTCFDSSICPAGEFPNTPGKTCDSCPTECKTYNSLADCLSCELGNFLFEGVCSPNCNAGYYKDGSDAANPVCTLCYTDCLTCDGGGDNDCLKCEEASGLFLHMATSKCVSSCPDGYHEVDSSNPSC